MTASTLAVGTYGDDVRHLQSVLVQRGHDVSQAELVRGFFGPSTRHALRQFQTAGGLPVTSVVDSATAKALGLTAAETTVGSTTVEEAARTVGRPDTGQSQSGPAGDRVGLVRGSVRKIDGTPATGVKVGVLKQQLRTQELLAEAVPDREGHYEIRFLYRPPGDGLNRRLTLAVVAVDAKGQRLASSPVIVHAGLEEVADLVVPDGREQTSEFEQHMAILHPLLSGVPVAELTEDHQHQDISFLAQESGLRVDEIVLLALSHRLQAIYGPPAEVFYALIRYRPPSAVAGSALIPHILADAVVRQIGNELIATPPAIVRDILTAAASGNIIAAQLGEQVDFLVAQLQQHRVLHTLDQPSAPGKASLRDVFKLADLPPEKHHPVAEAFADHPGKDTQVWARLAAEGQPVTSDELTRLRRTLELGAVTKHDLPVMRALKEGFDRGQHADISDLASLNLEDWKHIVRTSAPDGAKAIAGHTDERTDEDRVTISAKDIHDRLARAHPTAAMIGHVQAGNFVSDDVKPELVKFLKGNPHLDLHRTRLDALARSEGGKAMAGIDAAAQPKVLVHAQRLQRAMHLAPHPDHAALLLTHGIHSATQVHAMGEARLVQTMVRAGASAAEAHQTFHQAEQRYGMLLAQLSQLNRAFNQDALPVLPATVPTDAQQQTIDENPTLRALIGSQDFCACDECNSVNSPAAYLVDLLLFLRERTQTGDQPNAEAVLLSRRPDIATIKLNCANTNVPLPYVDLVCEVLEEAVSPGGSTGRQTTLRAEELRASPEYVNEQAYERLLHAVYPHTLPYHAWLDEVRSYLSQVGVARWRLMELFGSRNQATAGRNREQVAAEFFGLSEVERQLVTVPDSHRENEIWNLVDPVAGLARVSTFLDHSGLTYEELKVLLDVEFVRAGGPPSALSNVTDSCDTGAQTITNLERRLDLTHRFVRLWRRTGWKAWELDLLLRCPPVGNNQLDGATLGRLHAFRQLQTDLKLDTDQLLTFYQPLDVNSHSETPGKAALSQYVALFLNPAVTTHPDSKLEVTAVTATEVNEPIDQHIPAVLAALTMTEEDLSALLPLTDGRLTLGSLSTLYRLATLARAMGLTPPDLLRLLGHSDEKDPFADLDRTRTIVDLWQSVRKSGLTLDQVDYFLDSKPSPLAPTDDAIAGYLGQLRNEQQKIHDDAFASKDPASDRLTRQLARLPDLSSADLQATAIQIVMGSFAGEQAEQDMFIDAHFASLMEPAQAKAHLGGLHSDARDMAGRNAEIEERTNLLLAALTRSATTTRLKEVVASVFGLASDLASLLLSRLRLERENKSLLEVLSDPKLIEKAADSKGYKQDITPASFSSMFEAIRRLHKASVLATQLHLTVFDASWLLDHSEVYGGLDVSRLPAIQTDSAASLASLMKLVELVALTRTLSPARALTTLLDVVAGVGGGADLAGTQMALVKATGWDLADVVAMHDALAFTHPADYRLVSTYRQMLRCMATVTATGVRAARLAEWARREPDASDAAMVKQAVKAKYDNDQWLKIAPTLQDPVRERRRQALVEYLLGQPDDSGRQRWRNADDLFAHFLIDVEMSPCQFTSRIVQAYAAVQLFGQRCLMNLERPQVVADPDHDDKWLQWKWMQRYRLWEANRKVFLYPENWLIETQRPTRSPFFAELEDQLNQHEVTSDKVEDALLQYLHKLDDVAHLQVSGMYQDLERGVLHVVARTKSSPPRFYYRSFADGIWSPWEKIGIDIKAGSVSPVMYRSRLHLFWPLVNARPEEDQPVPAAQVSPDPPPKPEKHVEVQIGWSVRRNGKWVPAQISEGRLFDLPPRPNADYALKVSATDSAIEIDLFRSEIGVAKSNLGQLAGNLPPQPNPAQQVFHPPSQPNPAQQVFHPPSQPNPAQQVFHPPPQANPAQLAGNLAHLLPGELGGSRE